MITEMVQMGTEITPKRTQQSSEGSSADVCRICNVTKIYKPDIVANQTITLTINKGDTFGLLGPNGAGKTTLIKQLVGLLVPTAGDIYLNGIDVVNNPDMIPEFVAYLPQTLASLSHHTVFEAIFYTGLLRGLQSPTATAQTNDLLHLFEIGEVQNKKLLDLSGGQKQLVGLASTLIAYRPIIILDEPTNNLDPNIRRTVWKSLETLKHQHDLTIILVTHNVLEAEQILSRVALIDRGEIIACGSPASLKETVETRVRVEFRLKDNRAVKNLPGIQVEHLPEGRHRVRVSSDRVAETIERLFSTQPITSFATLEIIPPSLEDVYIELTNSGGNL